MIRQITNCGCEPDADAMRIIFDTGDNPNISLERPRADIFAAKSEEIDDTRTTIRFLIQKCCAMKITKRNHDNATSSNLFHFLAEHTA